LIRIGSAGWSYPDWEGVVYPRRTGHRFDPLAYLAEFVDCIEINSTFYRIPAPSSATGWAQRVSVNPDFRFTVKLWRGFTHGPTLPRGDLLVAEEEFRACVEPLRAAGRLGAVLVQYPYSFHNTQESRRKLRELLDRLEGLPLAVEIRHDSWLVDDFLEMLRERGTAFCNIDQPRVSRNVPATAHVTAEVGYARLHGRNAETWFQEGAGRNRRYDYLYSEEELLGWKDLVSGMAGAREIFVIANNHYRGQALANALELKSLIEERRVTAPAELLSAFPALAKRARAAEDRGRTDQRELPFS